jgi:hypothetical protein
LFGSSIAASVAASISYADASNDQPQKRGVDLRLDVTLIVNTGLGSSAAKEAAEKCWSLRRKQPSVAKAAFFQSKYMRPKASTLQRKERLRKV